MSLEAPLKTAANPGRQKAVLVFLLIVALGSIFLLPRIVQEPWLLGDTATGDSTPRPEPTGADAVAPSTAAEKTRYRQNSQAVLAEVIAIRDQLRSQGVERWGEVSFAMALDRVTQGDERYSYGEYAQSLEDYEAARDALQALEAEGRHTLQKALAEGNEAIETLNSNVARNARDLAQAIAPENPEVQALDTRVTRLPQLVELVDAADEARTMDKLGKAELGYREALALDPGHRRIAESLQEVRAVIVDRRFRGHMSRGYAAFERGRYDDAEAAFREAGTVRPGDAAVSQGIEQVQNARALSVVDQKIKAAEQHEANEAWAEAVATYQVLLEEDPSLADARARLLPAQIRADLDARLEALLEDPLALAAPAVYERGTQTLADARSITSPGERLSRQVASLARGLELAQSPVDVEFRSDNLTHVTLYRVAELGTFEATSLRLKPGRYVAAGIRQGFRDVRVEFTVTGLPLDAPIIVQCKEPI